MTEDRTSPLRERMIEDIRIRGLGDKAQQAHNRAIKNVAGFLKRSPDPATPDDLSAYQLHGGAQEHQKSSRGDLCRHDFRPSLSRVLGRDF
ncbi:hypothetical protein ABIA16_005333 [Sinorhizobium fredii]